MKYERDQVIAWAHRVVAGDSVSAIAREKKTTTRSIRRAFKRYGLALPVDYREGMAIPPPLPDEDAPADPAGVLDRWSGASEFVGPHLKRAIEGLIEHGTIENAAKALKLEPGQLRARLSEAKHIAARRGWSPAEAMTEKTAPGFHVKGTSGYYKVDPETGQKKLTGQWVKTDKDKEHRVQALLDAMRSTMAGYEGKAKPKKAPKHDTADYLAVYPMGDPHIGMFARAFETGDDDHDLARGEALLTRATESLVNIAPATKHALIINLGDFYHSDTKANVTLRSKNKLDVDGLWINILRVGIRAMITCIEHALRKHETVRVICEIGNHDDHSALMLSVALDLFFRNEPRVSIDMSPGKFHWYRFHNNLLGVTHGNTVKMSELPILMANDKREDWGETQHHYWYTGHVHHLQKKEFPGCIVESFRSLVPQDGYHAGAGYRGGRDMKLDLLHAQFGRVARHTIGVEQLGIV